ncbi:glycosyltransferase family 2 protein [Gelidibacter salicanalis]|uniref:Glycosyltransferase n=1 Tax=Gelidibacter salicanalis TaxID=291193 RepID=A0A934KVS1_9FLAO|nr:glycosyltransferase family 2 protein [Gelidibacter salicanalis]MBJ7881748.1 glycosyltransferase [Gelidibacter salicanalis]
MNDQNLITSPKKKELIILRTIIVIALLSVGNFFYWFLQPELIETPLLFGLLTLVIVFDTLRVVYIWYHYWNITIPTKPISKRQFKVDVLTTYFPGEPYEMTTQTLLAIKKMGYPHTTYLCDEANDAFLKNFCEEHDIVHVTRTNRIDAKAGNINNGLLHATGDLCLVLDPDHIPKPNFLEEIVPYFEDDAIGYVQTVQAYYNIDESYVAEGAAQQTFHFYGPMMMSMNSYGTVNAIGANCVFRRKALDSIGGHAAGLSEDMHTAMQLQAKGWKSVYVPKVFTKGLVPGSLTTYYKQQLKWSRGTLELLVSVYPKLFKKFSWRQKLHYGILPLHYLSGIFFLIGFLIPIISLVNASLPWRGNVIRFGLIYIPVLMSILCIRIYVQKWVMHKSERGIHINGGLLLMCTWWVFALGALYTVIRKKVPYLPTPKDDKEITNFKIVIPNLIVGVVSILAVIYGLSIDFTPFSIVMSGFALLNALIMFYTLVFAYQKNSAIQLPIYDQSVKYQKTTRNFVFNILSRSALSLVLITVISCAGLQYYGDYIKWAGVTPEKIEKHHINYIGVFAPKEDNGLTDIAEANTIANRVDNKFNLISLYLAWDKHFENSFPTNLIDSIYKQQSMPVITWEPWLNTFEDNIKDQHVYDLIVMGYFDRYLARFANTLKAINKPVFLRFAHEFDNPFYPWFIEGDNASEKFKSAWVHTYEIFKKEGADNVIWIWNPWKSHNISAFYPGKAYVDWMGVNVLNYGNLNADNTWYEFDALYQPFHDEFQNLPSTPVIISEFGSLNNNPKESSSKWIDNAVTSIETNFKEIKSIIYFNSQVDNNWPTGEKPNEYLDWTIPSSQTEIDLFSTKTVPSYIPSSLLQIQTNLPEQDNRELVLNTIKGINFEQGHNWQNDYHVLNRKKLLADFKNIGDLGITTIKYQGNSIYDHNVLAISKKLGLKMSYSFWIPENLDFMVDTLQIRDLKSGILKSIRALKSTDQIISWHIENDVQYTQNNFFHKPALLYQNRAFVLWLKDLASEIKKIDSKRPLIVDVEVNSLAIFHINHMVYNIKDIDAIGLVVKEGEYLDEVISYCQDINKHYIFSGIDSNVLEAHKIENPETSYFITSWQDKHESNKLDFRGIVDRKGRQKEAYLHLSSLLKNKTYKAEMPKVKILKPSRLIFEDNSYTFNAMVYDDKKGWQVASKQKDLKFEWSLVKCDAYGNYLAIKEMGTEAKISLKIPKNHTYYKLHLTIIHGDNIASDITSFNTPVIAK